MLTIITHWWFWIELFYKINHSWTSLQLDTNHCIHNMIGISIRNKKQNWILKVHDVRDYKFKIYSRFLLRTGWYAIYIFILVWFDILMIWKCYVILNQFSSTTIHILNSCGLTQFWLTRKLWQLGTWSGQISIDIITAISFLFYCNQIRTLIKNVLEVFYRMISICLKNIPNLSVSVAVKRQSK